MSILYLMTGCPGAGKSTFLQNLKKYKNDIVVSRDAIRFSIVKPDEEYFSHEDEVLYEFWKQINEALKQNKNVFIDQTSLTPKSRKQVLKKAQGYDKAYLIWIDEDLKTCLQRNKKRVGTRGYVPPAAICRMYKSFVKPSCFEGFDRIYHYNSKENKLTYQEKRGSNE